jgi:hypothetical protein
MNTGVKRANLTCVCCQLVSAATRCIAEVLMRRDIPSGSILASFRGRSLKSERLVVASSRKPNVLDTILSTSFPSTLYLSPNNVVSKLVTAYPIPPQVRLIYYLDW